VNRRSFFTLSAMTVAVVAASPLVAGAAPKPTPALDIADDDTLSYLQNVGASPQMLQVWQLVNNDPDCQWCTDPWIRREILDLPDADTMSLNLPDNGMTYRRPVCKYKYIATQKYEYIATSGEHIPLTNRVGTLLGTPIYVNHAIPPGTYYIGKEPHGEWIIIAATPSGV